ncbi:MAG: hypothetical protein ACP5GY_07840, partial [Vulcanisaeta sp.]
LNKFKEHEEAKHLKPIIDTAIKALESLLNKVNDDLKKYWANTIGYEIQDLIKDIISEELR